MTVKKKLKTLFFIFTIITTGIVISAAITIILIAGSKTVDSAILWQILVVSVACTLPTLIWFGKRTTFIHVVIHYLFINGIVLGFSYLFGWFDFGSFLNILPLLLMILGVYLAVFFAGYCVSSGESKKINEKLKSRFAENADGDKKE